MRQALGYWTKQHHSKVGFLQRRLDHIYHSTINLSWIWIQIDWLWIPQNCTIVFDVVGPQLDWDPDIVAGLDEDFNFDDPENQLEDDFVVQAMDGEVEMHEEDNAEPSSIGGRYEHDI